MFHLLFASIRIAEGRLSSRRLTTTLCERVDYRRIVGGAGPECGHPNTEGSGVLLKKDKASSIESTEVLLGKAPAGLYTPLAHTSSLDSIKFFFGEIVE